MIRTFTSTVAALVVAALLVTASFVPSTAQEYGTGTRNIRLISSVGLGMIARADAAAFLVDVRLDQRENKPYAYVAEQSGWAVIDLSDPSSPKVAALVPAEYAPELGDGISAIDYLSIDGMDYVAVGYRDRLIVYDASGLAAGGQPEEVAAVQGEFGSLFAYKHSSGSALLIASSGGYATVYDASALVSGSVDPHAEIPSPEQIDSTFGYESVMAAYHADSESDRFYGAGAAGYHVYDITNADSVKYVTSAMPAAVRRGLSVAPSADGRYLVTTAEYRTAPVRLFDLSPVTEGEVSIVRVSVGAWANDWRGFHLRQETRWPYVFVASAERGLQVFNAMDPAEPYTVGHFETSRRPDGSVNDSAHQVGGAIAIDVRNHDGLIAVGDQQSGVWFLDLEAFDSWDGRGWGYPNISSAQDWVNGPDGSSKFE